MLSTGGHDESVTFSPRMREALPEARVSENYWDILNEIECDVAVVSPRFDRHSEVAAYFLERGVHVFCEKPLSFGHERLE